VSRQFDELPPEVAVRLAAWLMRFTGFAVAVAAFAAWEYVSHG
jgi:hypothetical protein